MRHQNSLVSQASKWIIIAAALLVAPGCEAPDEDLDRSGSGSSTPYYFIAIHNEPFHDQGGEQILAHEYSTLKEMVQQADQYHTKLTLMFTAQWSDYILKDAGRKADLAGWESSGHEIAAHHHSIYHGNWDGYTEYSRSEAEAQRMKQGKNPAETYLGTLKDYMSKLLRINPQMISGCVNDEVDKRAMPDEIVYDTCSGYANYGEPGRRESDATSAKKGQNDYVTVGTYNSIKRRWLTYYDFLAFLHGLDPTGARSRTVAEVIDFALLTEKSISDTLVNSKYSGQGKQPPNEKCGDGACDALEQANPKLCPTDCNK